MLLFAFGMVAQLGPLTINGTNFYSYSDVRFQDCNKNWWQDMLFVRSVRVSSITVTCSLSSYLRN